MAEDTDQTAVKATLQDKISYFYGYSFGQRLLESGTSDVNFQRFQAGFEDALGKRSPTLSQTDQQEIIAELTRRQKNKQETAARQGLDEARTYLVENAEKDGVQVTASGLQYQVIQAAEGRKPGAKDRVKVHYKGELVNGQEFDSSIKRGEPAEFGLNQVIPGWTEGLQLMSIGAKYRLTIPPELGYGPGGQGKIPPNSVLIFEVELLDIL